MFLVSVLDKMVLLICHYLLIHVSRLTKQFLALCKNKSGKNPKQNQT